MRPLDGIRVADFSRVLAGPLCTMILADLGADVVKVERPGTGDETRGWGPPFVGDDAAYFLSVNRNKRSVTLDLATEAGRRAGRALALRSDVLVENFRPGRMERFGLGHQELRGEHPSLVYCSITAMGGGADPEVAGYDLAIQALTGLMSITGPKDGEPTKVGVALLDVVAGLYAAVGILAALRAREAGGQGRRVEVSLFEAGVASLVNQAANHLLGGEAPGRMGNEHPNIVPYQVFHAADGPFVLAAGNDGLFARACEAFGVPELVEDARFRTNGDRVRHREELTRALQGVLGRAPVEGWLRRLAAAGVPAAPVRSLDEVFASPEGRAITEELADPVRGVLRSVGDPIRLSDVGPPDHRPPPRLGEHTEEILRELGLT